VKTCHKCGVEKPYSEFTKDQSTDDWFSKRCKSCCATYMKERRQKIRQDPVKYEAHLARKTSEREAAKNWGGAYDPQSQRVAGKKWMHANREKKRAHRTVKKAVDAGRLIRKSCVVCGNPKAEAHHKDYSKRLEVVWLCKTHHAKEHRKPVEGSESRGGAKDG
jgi:hypothetical protein